MSLIPIGYPLIRHYLFPILTKAGGEIINGLMISEEGTLIHSALAKNIPIIALPYFCQPNSEINQILGLNQNEHYNLVLKQNIERLISMGITFAQ